MAQNLSNYLENKLLEHSLGKTAYTFPTNVRVALYSSNPGEDDSGTEITSGSMVRQPLTVDAAVSGATQNDGELVWPINTGAQYTVTHVGIKDATTGGNLLWYGPCTNKVIDTGDQYRMPDAELDFGLN